MSELYPTHFLYRTRTGVVSIHQYGDKGIVFGMSGSGLLRDLAEDFMYGSLRHLKTLEGYVLLPVAKKIMSMQTELNVTITDRCHADGRDVVWIRVEK
jgi:hypothetical protein